MHAGTNGKLKRPEIAYDDAPPKAGPALFVKRLKGEEALTVCILGDHVFGIWAHWSGKKSEPHYTDAKSCPGCQAAKAKRWKGYLHVYDYNTNREIILELTPASAHQLRMQLGRETGMRGERIRVVRSKGDNGRLTITVLATTPNPETLPKEKDPRPVILKLWGVDQEDPDGWLDQGGEKDGGERFNL